MATQTMNSLETILTFENAELNEWSMIWSTTHIPGMDNATGGQRRRLAGRRRLRAGAFTIAALLSMHCRVAASALTGGYFVFIMLLVMSVALLANPLRHFEVYLGQWSISGPGRAFRIIPMLDGIGLAMCINSIIRAIVCTVVAAIAILYVVRALSDSKLPFTYCRDFNLKSYSPVLKDVSALRMLKSRFSTENSYTDDMTVVDDDDVNVGTNYAAWRNSSTYLRSRKQFSRIGTDSRDTDNSKKIAMCKETYDEGYPVVYSTPAFNYFYVEVAHYRSGLNFELCNIPLIISVIASWIVLWLFMLIEKISHGRLIWNNVQLWFVAVPWLWATLLIITSCLHFTKTYKALRKVFRVGAKEIFAGIGDALEIALYTHSAGTGTELIHGKGLNHYASGHIDPQLNGENVIHSCLVLLLTAINTGGAAVCALVDYIQPKDKSTPYDMRESTLWILPMYSKCAIVGNYSHVMTTLIFGGLAFSYMTVAYILLKTALHTIFEYRVKLVFVEQVVVGALMLVCMGLSLIFTTTSGLAILESVDALMSSLAIPCVCLYELVALLYVYRGSDFISDMNVATEDNSCSSRMGTQWHIIPLVTVVAVLLRSLALASTEMPSYSVYMSLLPLVCVLIAVPLRACRNAYVFLRRSRKRAT